VILIEKASEKTKTNQPSKHVDYITTLDATSVLPLDKSAECEQVQMFSFLILSIQEELEGYDMLQKACAVQDGPAPLGRPYRGEHHRSLRPIAGLKRLLFCLFNI